MSDRSSIFLPPDEYAFKAWNFRDILVPWSSDRPPSPANDARIFCIPYAADLEVVAAIRSSLDDALRQGQTFEAWRARIRPTLQSAGWWGLVKRKSLTGCDNPVVVNDRRLERIFRTNIRLNSAADRWLKIQREKEGFPYLRYLSDHHRHRPHSDHRKWHGLILPVDHPWWLAHFPPNGPLCHCRPQQLTQGMLERRNWSVAESDAGIVLSSKKDVSTCFAWNPGAVYLNASLPVHECDADVILDEPKARGEFAFIAIAMAIAIGIPLIGSLLAL